jgi:hypothetical protein
MSKSRSDSVMKNLPEERQEQIIAWCDTPKTKDCAGGYEHARAQLASDGIKVSLRSLSDFYSWWHLSQDFAQADRQAVDIQELLKSLNVGLTKEQIETAGQMVFTQKAIAMRNAEEFREMEYLKLAKESAATRGRQKDEELSLKRKKFQRDSAKLFLVWFQDEEAKRIASSGGTKAEKIEALGRHLFDDWDEN